MNQVEKLIMEGSKILGAKKNGLNAMKYALEKKDAKWFRQNLMAISNLPPLIELPKWLVPDRSNLGSVEIRYAWRENSKVKIIMPREKLNRVPDICTMTVKGVSLAQVKDYQKELEKGGLPCSAVREKGGRYYAVYNIKGGGFTIIWENNIAVIHMDNKPVCFIPYLYLLARKNL